MKIGFRRIGFACFAGLTCFALLTTVAARAQTPPAAVELPAEHRETIIGGTPSSVTAYERCVDVEIGGDRSLGCLNQKLKREVERINPSINTPPLDARSPDVRVGNVNEAAVRQQYGSNYGRSVYPFRPPPPTFNLHR
jgi:hypothetical protein